MGKEDDIFYAVNLTRVILPPSQTLETFGTTCIHYHLISELMDTVNRIRIRSGKIFSERPRLITPGQYGQKLLDGFGEQAQAYADWLRQQGKLIKVLQYGLQFRKDQAQQEIISDTLEAVAERVRGSVEKETTQVQAVIIGADELWEVSLLKFFIDFIQYSAPTNIREMQDREQQEKDAERRALHMEIEREFQLASQDSSRIQALGRKLEKHNLFATYEDRFYSLLR